MVSKCSIRRIFFIILIGTLISGCISKAINTPIGSPAKTKTDNTETIYPTRTIIAKSLTPSITVSPTGMESLATETPMPRVPIVQLTYVSHPNNEESVVYAVDLYCYQPQTTCLGEPKLLFEWNDWISGIDWSPDGKKVAFSSGLYAGDLVIADWNGENAKQVTNGCEAADSPKWSPDGTKVAFIFSKGVNNCEYLGDAKIESYEPATGKETTLLPNALSPSRLEWLKDGKFAYISNSSNTERNETIYIVDTNGTIIKQLPKNTSDYTHLLGITFSPNDQQVAFVGDIWPKTGTETIDIYVTDIIEGNVVNLTNGSGTNLSPDWSPKNDWIAFDSDRTGNSEIYLIKPDGTGLMQITKNGESYTDSAWRVLP
jgi:Tol biopolymer transport system component